MRAPLADKLGVGRPEMVAFVGAGGKSSLLLRLGAELAEAGRRVVVTTTTKMGAGQIPRWATTCRTEAEVTDGLGRGEAIFLVGDISADKVTGVGPESLDRVFVDLSPDYVLLEADGARGRSIKAPAPYEPVIPTETTLVVVVVGIDAVGRPIADAAHRPDLLAALLERSLEDPVRPIDIARAVSHPEGGRQWVPDGVRVTVALTKVTPGPAPVAATRITELLADTLIDRVAIIESHPGVGNEDRIDPVSQP